MLICFQQSCGSESDPRENLDPYLTSKRKHGPDLTLETETGSGFESDPLKSIAYKEINLYVTFFTLKYMINCPLVKTRLRIRINLYV